MIRRFALGLALIQLTCWGADLSANEIMLQVAAHQDAALELRRAFTYEQRVDVTTRRFGGKLIRQENAEYDVAPGAGSQQKTLRSLNGRLEKSGHVTLFTAERRQSTDSLDADLISSFRDDLLNEKNRDGVGNDLFPLTTEEQKDYRFELMGHTSIAGRDNFRIAFKPRDSSDIGWSGEALIDVEELQPLRVFTQLSRKIPFAVRILLGTDVPGLGFNVQYARVEKNVWFPVSFGCEFRLHAIYFIKREISMSMTASGFRRAQVDSKVDYIGVAK